MGGGCQGSGRMIQGEGVLRIKSNPVETPRQEVSHQRAEQIPFIIQGTIRSQTEARPGRNVYPPPSPKKSSVSIVPVEPA